MTDDLPFQHCSSTKQIGKGSYGRVELVELSPEAAFREFNIKINNNNNNLLLARKVFFRYCFLITELYNINKLKASEEGLSILNNYFVKLYRAYTRKIHNKVIVLHDHNDNNDFHVKTDNWYLDMEYLQPTMWTSLKFIKYNRKLKNTEFILHILKQLLLLQCKLISIGGIYYDPSPSNVFISNDENQTVRMIDYGGLYFPDNMDSEMEEYDCNHRIPDPFYSHTFPRKTMGNLTVYSSRYFYKLGKQKKIKHNPIPPFHAIITTINMCASLLGSNFNKRVLQALIKLNEEPGGDIYNNIRLQNLLIKKLMKDPLHYITIIFNTIDQS